MKPPATILVPVDLSRRSESAVAYACMLANSFGSDIVLMTNLDVAERRDLEEFAITEHLTIEQAAEAALQRIIAAYAGPETSASFVISSWEVAAEAILEAAETAKADLIVLASHGRSGFSRWTLGSVAEKVTRSASVPAVVVPART